MIREEHSNKHESNRRVFLTSCAVGAVAASQASAVEPSAEQAIVTAIDFDRSFLYCIPIGTDIWVRPKIECRLEVFDHKQGQSDEYVLSVVAKTGLTKNQSTGGLNPGYDYWIIFSREQVYTHRTHTSSYFNNPTTHALDEFGMARWRLQYSPAVELRTGRDVRRALENWQPIVARSEFTDDGNRGFAIDYPVKWADFNLKTNAFRVETGPVILTDVNKIQPQRTLEFEDFQWAHLDYHSFDRVRCLLDVPISILMGATFVAPNEHGREKRANPALSEADVKQIIQRLSDWPDAPLPADAMRALFQTDHYSAETEVAVTTKLYALNAQS